MATNDPSRAAPWRSDILAAFVGLAPISIGWIYRVFVNPRPFWIGFYDPETIHFYAGLQMLRGEVPGNTDNPATPLQVASALIEFLGRMSTVDFDRFRVPAYGLAAALAVAGAIVFVRVIARGLPLPLEVASVWVYFLAPHALIYAAVWSPEILYFFAGSVALAAIVWSWSAGSGLDSTTPRFSRSLTPPARPPLLGMTAGWRASLWWSRWRRVADRDDETEGGTVVEAGVPAGERLIPVLVAGAAIGFLCSIKFVFLGWAPAYVASLLAVSSFSWRVRVRHSAVATAGVIAGFVFFTLPVISKYPAMFAWVGGIMTKSGFYGRGGTGLPSESYVMENVRAALMSGKAFHLVFAVALAGLVLVLFRKEHGDRRLALQALTFVLVASGLTYAMALKHFNHRYLLPSALAAVLAFVIAAKIFARGRRTVAWIVALAMLALVIKTVRHDVRTHDEMIRLETERRAAVESFVREDARSRRIASPVVVYGDFPTPSFALRYFATQGDLVALDRVFPREGTWGTNLFGEIHLPRGVRTWDYLVVQKRLTELYPESWEWIDRERTPFIDGTWVVRRGMDRTP